jgi:hypothetical protein
MRLFDMGLGNRRQYVATLLGLSPNHPESWPMEMIDRLISESEEHAWRKLQDAVQRALGK